MKDSRIGECLWSEWTGEDHEHSSCAELFFFTEEHVDMEHEVVRRALASALQRDGSAVSLGDGFKLVESAESYFLYAGEVDGNTELTICDESGETRNGDIVEDVKKITIVAL
jgi:hypothetical protein